MKLHKNITAFLLSLAIFASLACFAAAPISAQSAGGASGSANKEDDTEKVLELFKQKRFAEAAPYLEKLVKADPTDADLRFLYGFSLFIKAATIDDKGEGRKLLVLARQQFVKAKELGSKEETLDKMIALLPKDESDGSSNTSTGNTSTQNYSKDKEAEDFMNKGEGFFAGGEYDKAFDMYQKALKKDPGIYEAALYSGDVFLQKGEFDKAETWYQKAIVINPNRETAYRYSATPLMKQKKYEQARDRYIEAYITEPYNSRAQGGLKQWAEVTSTEVGHPIIDIPANVSTSKSGDVNLTLGTGDKTDDGSFAWTTYGLTRSLWQSNKDGLSESFKKAYPAESKYRHSLAEEFDSLKLTVSTLKQRMNAKDNPVKKLNPQLATLVKIYDDGLLEPYILLALKDEDIVKDYPEYLKQNRDKLRKYVVKYVVGNGE